MGNKASASSKETDALLGGRNNQAATTAQDKAEQGTHSNNRGYETTPLKDWDHPHNPDVYRDYHDFAVTVVENEDHEPVVVHDLSGPVLYEFPGLERTDSIVSSIYNEAIVDLKSAIGDDVFTSHHVEGAHGQGQATISQEIASMAKNLIGCGALSLCNGIALCADTPQAITAAIFWIVVMGILFGYFCWLIAKICEITKRSTYRGIWQETVGHRGALAVSVANTLKALMADLAYASILSDTVKSLLASANWQVPRLVCLLLITIVGILPLCMLKNLAVLAPVSVVGTAGMLLTTAVMAIRYMDGSYLPGGQFHDHMAPSQQPSFGDTNRSWSFGILPFVCMVYEAYVMHYNSPRFYTELKRKSLPRFSVAVSSSFTLSAFLYAGIAAFGFLTFGGNSNSFILNNYSPYDILATFSRLAVGLSTLIAYPIVFMGVRDGVLDIFEVSLADQTPKKLNQLTYVLLSMLTLIAIFVTDLGLINAVGGGLVSTAIVFVFPTIMYRVAATNIPGEAWQVVMTSAFAVFGLIIGLVGVYIAVSDAVSK